MHYSDIQKRKNVTFSNNTKYICYMKQLVYISFIVVFSIFSNQLNAQNSVQYTYDVSGNRTERNMVQLPPENPSVTSL